VRRRLIASIALVGTRRISTPKSVERRPSPSLGAGRATIRSTTCMLRVGPEYKSARGRIQGKGRKDAAPQLGAARPRHLITRGIALQSPTYQAAPTISPGGTGARPGRFRHYSAGACGRVAGPLLQPEMLPAGSTSNRGPAPRYHNAAAPKRRSELPLPRRFLFGFFLSHTTTTDAHFCGRRSGGAGGREKIGGESRTLSGREGSSPPPLSRVTLEPYGKFSVKDVVRRQRLRPRIANRLLNGRSGLGRPFDYPAAKFGLTWG